jgi:hypothetical protein
VPFFRAHIHHIRERNIFQNNEWAGWFQGMRAAFLYGDLGTNWVEGKTES